MTKKHFAQFVEDLATAQNQTVDAVGRTSVEARTVINATLRQVARAFAYSAKQDNPRFDEGRFYQAITLQTGISF